MHQHDEASHDTPQEHGDGKAAWLRKLRAETQELSPLQWLKGVGELLLFCIAVIGAGAVLYQLTQTERAIHIDQRPWLVFQDATDKSGEGQTFPENPNTVLVWIKNTGNSPALDTRPEACPFMGPNRPHPEIPCRPMARPGRVTVGPDQRFFIGVEDVVIRDHARFGSGADKLWILTRLTYGDVFGHTHRSEFCIYWAVDLQAWFACDGPAKFD